MNMGTHMCTSPFTTAGEAGGLPSRIPTVLTHVSGPQDERYFVATNNDTKTPVDTPTGK